MNKPSLEGLTPEIIWDKLVRQPSGRAECIQGNNSHNIREFPENSHLSVTKIVSKLAGYTHVITLLEMLMTCVTPLKSRAL